MTESADRRLRPALVTGASSGIGRALAIVLASHAYDVVLVARREEKLEELAAELESKYGVRTWVMVADLSDIGAPQALFDQVSDLGLELEVLVNNAGYGVPGSYEKTTWETQRDFIQVLVTAVAHLTHLFLPGMIARSRGKIMNVASVAGLLPGSAGHTLYGASKAFVIRMTESLSLELEGTSVTATAVCPGLTFSEFHDVTGTREQVSKLPGYFWMDAETVARQGYLAMLRGEPVYINGVPNRLLALLSRLLPQRLARAISKSKSSSFRTVEPDQK